MSHVEKMITSISNTKCQTIIKLYEKISLSSLSSSWQESREVMG